MVGDHFICDGYHRFCAHLKPLFVYCYHCVIVLPNLCTQVSATGELPLSGESLNKPVLPHHHFSPLLLLCQVLLKKINVKNI